MADEQSVIAGGGAGVDGVHPAVEVTVAEVEVELNIQRGAQVGAGILPHLEDGGGGQQHDIRYLLAGDGIGRFSGGDGQHGQRQHESQNQSYDLFHGKPPIHFWANTVNYRPLLTSV